MKIYNRIKKLAPICAVFGALAFTSCNDEPAEEDPADPAPAEETTPAVEGTE
jgi:hypothetical protein